ncbi:MAG: tetratricopeptide repeat protein [Rhodothermales bacterium]
MVIRFFALGVLLCFNLSCTKDHVATPPLDPVTQRHLDDVQSALNGGSLEMALAFADSAVSTQPQAADAHFTRGQVLLQMNNTADAAQAFRESLSLNADYPSAWFNLGNISFVNRQYSDAIASYEKEAVVEERQQEKFGASYAVKYKETMSRLSLQKGRAHRQLMQEEEAMTAFREAIAFDKMNAGAFADLSQSLRDAGLTDEALDHAEQALQLVPAHPDYNYLVGALKQEHGSAEDALPLLQRAVQLKPWFSQARYSMGLALVELGEEEAGKQQLQIADTLKALNDRIEKARIEAQSFPDEHTRWLNLGQLLIQSGRLGEAMQPFFVAESLEPDNLAIKNDIANLSLIQGDTLGAIRRLDQMLARQPAFADGWYNLGVMHALRGDFQKARNAWQQTLKLNPAHPEAKQNLDKISDK